MLNDRIGNEIVDRRASELNELLGIDGGIGRGGFEIEGIRSSKGSFRQLRKP